VVQLVGVEDGPDRLHPAVGDVEGEHVDDPVLRVVSNGPGLAVDVGWLDADAHLRRPAVQPEQQPGHSFGSGDRLGRCPGLAAAVAHHNHVGREQFQQAAEVAAGRRLEKPVGDLVALLAGGVEARLAVVDVVPGPGQDLAAVRLGLAGDAGDLLVVVAEHLVQQEHRSFGRCQAL
jgi:hypothetical protein